MKRLLILIFIVFAIHQLAIAQDSEIVQNPPVNFELLVADRGLDAELAIIKKTQKYPKFGFFSATSILTNWNSSTLEDFMHQSALTYELVKGLDIDLGYEYTPFTQFRLSGGFMYNFFKGNWAFNISPRVDLSGSNNGIEEFSFVTYTPKLNDKYSLYTRLQSLYNIQIKDGEHERSYFWIRAGLTSGDFTFGVGANFDRYGPEKFYQHHLGVFGAMNLF